MTAPPPATPGTGADDDAADGFKDDDQHWLDLMAGRAAPEADARTRKQAAWLRAALLSYRGAAPAGAPAPPDARAARLLARAREAGVLPAEVSGMPAGPASLANPALRRVAPANRWRYALAASVAVLAVALVWMPGRFAADGSNGDHGDSGTLRGAAVQRIEAPDPVQRRDQLLQALRAAGFDAQPFERLGRAGIDIALPVPLPAAQAAALARLGLAPPAGPSLQVEVVSPAPVVGR